MKSNSPHFLLILAGVPSNLADSPSKSANSEGIRQIWRNSDESGPRVQTYCIFFWKRRWIPVMAMVATSGSMRTIKYTLDWSIKSFRYEWARYGYGVMYFRRCIIKGIIILVWKLYNIFANTNSSHPTMVIEIKNITI